MLRSIQLIVATTCLFVTAPAAAQADEPSLGADKALHFGASFAISIVGYCLGTEISDQPVPRLLMGAGLGVVAGVGKELFDLVGPGRFEWLDLAFDALGIATGLFMAWAVDRILARRLRRAAPAFR